MAAMQPDQDGDAVSTRSDDIALTSGWIAPASDRSGGRDARQSFGSAGPGNLSEGSDQWVRDGNADEDGDEDGDGDEDPYSPVEEKSDGMDRPEMDASNGGLDEDDYDVATAHHTEHAAPGTGSRHEFTYPLDLGGDEYESDSPRAPPGRLVTAADRELRDVADEEAARNAAVPHEAALLQKLSSPEFRHQLGGFPSIILTAVLGVLSSNSSLAVLLNMCLTPDVQQQTEAVVLLIEALATMLDLPCAMLDCTEATEPSDLCSPDACSLFDPSRAPDEPTTDSVGTPLRPAAALSGALLTPLVVLRGIDRLRPVVLDALTQAARTRELVVGGRAISLPPAQCLIAVHRGREGRATSGGFPRQFLDLFANELVPDSRFLQVLLRHSRQHVPRGLLPWQSIRSYASHVHTSYPVRQYSRDVIVCARQHASVLLGPSPQGWRALLDTARVRAMLSGERFVRPQDIDAVAVMALAHRLVLRLPVTVTARELVHDIVFNVLVPPK